MEWISRVATIWGPLRRVNQVLKATKSEGLLGEAQFRFASWIALRRVEGLAVARIGQH